VALDIDRHDCRLEMANRRPGRIAADIQRLPGSTSQPVMAVGHHANDDAAVGQDDAQLECGLE